MSFDLFPVVKRLYDRLTQQRADWLDNLEHATQTRLENLDASVSSRADGSITARSDVCREDRLSRLDVEIRGIRRIQQYSYEILGTEFLVEYPITPIADFFKSCLIMSYHDESPPTTTSSAVSVSFLGSDKVRLQHYGGPTQTDKRVYVYVVEFY